MRPNHKKYTFEIEIPIMEAFKECCKVYDVSQLDMINDVMLKFINETETILQETVEELEKEERQPKLFSLLNSKSK